jgi:ubiquinone/menaquinone biosynthesis C-methylase UbiE
MSAAIYDEIGQTYDTTRSADPKIIKEIVKHLSPCLEGDYLDIGCGSGNYTEAIFKKGFNICGIDISQVMLNMAKKKNPQIEWIHGDAGNLPFSDNLYDGAICILATHHIQNLDKAFQEIFRVIRKGIFVIFTALPEQMKQYWLNEYFPNMIFKSSEFMSSFENLSQALQSAGFQDIKMEKFFVTNELRDLFLQSGKYRPQIYLDPSIRSGISSFAMEQNQIEVALGCERLQKDILSGKTQEVIQSYENELGDYVFISGLKSPF